MHLSDNKSKENWFIPPKNGFVPQKGSFVCPSKRATYLSPQNDNLFVPRKGHLICVSKRTTCLSLKKDNLFVPQKGHHFCAHHSISSYYRVDIPPCLVYALRQEICIIMFVSLALGHLN